MRSPKKEFTLTHVFDNMETEEFDFFTVEEKHYNVFWNLNLCQYNGNVEFYIISSLTEDDGSVAGSVDSDWSEPDGEEYCVETELDIKLTFADGKKIEEKRKVVFKTGDDSMHEFMCIPWSDLTRECSVDGKVKVEVRVKILKATGTETKKLMNFDEAMKDFSDAVLVVKKEKFYISKLFLAYQSTYFKSLLLGGFKESEKSEIVLKDIDPEDFQKFLEVLYGEDAVDDDTVEGIVHLADMYDAPKVLKRCEQFLMKKSRKSLKSKLKLSAKYNMDSVKNKCLADIKTVADIQSVLPENLEEMDHSLMASVLRKAMSHLTFHSLITMSTLKKEFSMSCTFKKVPTSRKCKNYSSFSKQEDHYNFQWRLSLKEADQKAVVNLHLIEPKDASDFSVETECDLTVFDVNGICNIARFTYKFKPGDDNSGITFSSWKRLSKTYLKNGELEVEAHVKIQNISGFEYKKLKVFDESMKQFSDIVLVAGEEKFYVSKLFLASHSSYFNSLLLGKFDESKKSEVNLKDIDPDDFQRFLEVLHGEDAINDSTIEGIVRLADMYDAPTAHRRCEKFMMKESEKSLKEKLELSARYKMIRVKNKCLSEIKTAKDIKSVVPENIDEMDPSLTAAILKKAISHLK
ncbi:hypothetical protein CRE_21419 [Caenorhabditis remanei]|uniref:BTB domain-containing protein n=1 Tax=Caenorhabditis remanei TaxID=31234 RepID=E3MUU9_CAERE|nr:hypothetical protein CRE_21419 [Caenorhabditis remanei]